MIDLSCPDDVRRARFRAATTPLPHAIDYVEVLPTQHALVVHAFGDLPVGLGPDNVAIEGGVTITPVRVTAAARADVLPPAVLDAADEAVVASMSAADQRQALVIHTDSSGDFSTYTVRLIPPAGTVADYDPVLSSAEFSFKVDCPSDFDCETDDACPPDLGEPPRIDYLAKDYASFRRTMLDRLAQTVPDWQDRNPVDLGVTVVESIAYAADLLSYQQDAAATEAYLGTARLRSSVRRHVRLLDYPFHDGSNARAWVVLTGADGASVERGRRIVSDDGPDGSAPADLERDLEAAVASGIPVFETLHDIVLRTARDEVPLHAWGDPDCCLLRGATSATLRASATDLALARGDLLVLEEVRGWNGRADTADPSHRVAVRLVADPVPGHDPLDNVDVTEVRWHPDDALPFALAVGEGDGGPRSVARGNVVLADHGLSVTDPPVLVPAGRFRPGTTRPGITQAVPFDPVAAGRESATATLSPDPEAALPALRFFGEGLEWLPLRDLLGSDAFAPAFVYELEDDGTGLARFGDDVHGRRPAPGETYEIRYRIGTGPGGNVGRERLARVVGINPPVAARNPLAAAGGRPPEATEHARLHAPTAFRIQQRAVTEDDYALVAQRHPEVQKAAATRRWTGSWMTVYLTVDRRGGLDVDAAFKASLLDWLDQFRMAGYDLEIDGPRWVPLDLELGVCVKPGYIRSDVERAIRTELSNRDLPDGRRGFFHPDLWTFGQPLYLSAVLARVMAVAGVVDCTPVHLHRWRGLPAGELEARQLDTARLEIVRLDDDPSSPEYGHLTLDMEGGS